MIKKMLFSESKNFFQVLAGTSTPGRMCVYGRYAPDHLEFLNNVQIMSSGPSKVG